MTVENDDEALVREVKEKTAKLGRLLDEFSDRLRRMRQRNRQVEQEIGSFEQDLDGCEAGSRNAPDPRPARRPDRGRNRLLPAPAPGRNQAIPAALNAARTRAGVSGALRIRTPVASNSAFAIAAPTLVDGGSPEPLA
jgi:hypothetical protein